ncbi:hypothetical protein RM553_15740 [Zunongwangia sp. F363]|uniref:Uncharacterized protein n=1 Tax=Autumnicola tepida TaxID=3075595 RepID=A0ABU3CE41_9FLAO|nr:hypothetical protein [Zunongwangia sp. F363]MDT0644290.1 hypothetical protein [Zunongwangia sp. F363]
MKMFFFLTLCMLFFSCSDDDLQVCPNGLNETWFNDFKSELDDNCFSETSIFQGIYNGETVYYQLITDPLVNFQAFLKFYNCEGNLVADLSAEGSNNYLDGPGRDDDKIYTCSE